MLNKAFIWDFDGTLFDTYPVMETAINQAVAQHHVHFDGDVAKYIKQYSIRQFAHEYADQDFIDTYHAIEAQLQTEPRAYTEIPQILKAVVDHGGQNFILSHRDDKTWAYLGDLNPYFSGGVTSDLGLKRKPDPEAINYLIDNYQLNRDTTIMIGDRPLDVEAGINAKIQTLLFDEHHLFDDYKGTPIIHSWKEFNINDY
jgi:HAD superfamily hydrolase (TIGR01549 family)